MQAAEGIFMHAISIHKHTAHTDESCQDEPAKDPGSEKNKERAITTDLML